MPLHPLVQHFADKKQEFLTSDFVGFVLREGDRRGIPLWRTSDAARSLEAMATVGENPWQEILQHLTEFGREDIDFLVDNMSSGWARAKVMEFQDALATKVVA